MDHESVRIHVNFQTKQVTATIRKDQVDELLYTAAAEVIKDDDEVLNVRASADGNLASEIYKGRSYTNFFLSSLEHAEALLLTQVKAVRTYNVVILHHAFIEELVRKGTNEKASIHLANAYIESLVEHVREGGTLVAMVPLALKVNYSLRCSFFFRTVRTFQVSDLPDRWTLLIMEGRNRVSVPGPNCFLTTKTI